VVRLPLGEIPELISSGSVADAKTLVGLLTLMVRAGGLANRTVADVI
jgi:hypothetical protein